MLPQRVIESFVGLFLLFAIIALTVLAFKISGLTSIFPSKSYIVTAAFDDIGALKVRSPIKIGGVQIGEVLKISLDHNTFKAIVKMRIDNKYSDIPDDSSAGILTAGLLGDNYIAITPMYNTTFLKNDSQIQFTRSAMVLEKLIGQFMYKMGNTSNKSEPGNNNQANLKTSENGEHYASQ